MVRNKHQEDSDHGLEGNNDLEAMISCFGQQEVCLSTEKKQLENRATENCLNWTFSCWLLCGMGILLGSWFYS